MKTMKDIIKEISKWTSIIISVLMFAVACSDDKEDGAPEEPAPAAPAGPTQEELLTQIRDLLKEQNRK